LKDKSCAKGIKHSTNRNRKQYLDALYNTNKQDYATEDQFVFDKQQTQINIVSIQKKLLNNFYTKYAVQKDLVTLKPLRKNNQFI